MECGLGGNIQSGLRIYFILFLDKFVLKAWVSRRVSYFVGSVLDGYIFLPGCPQVLSMFFFFWKQVLSLLNVEFWGIFEPRKSPV